MKQYCGTFMNIQTKMLVIPVLLVVYNNVEGGGGVIGLKIMKAWKVQNLF